MRWLYTVLVAVLSPGLLAYMGWRGLRNRAYWQRWGERWGRLPATVQGPYALWIHAVSVGEVQVALPLVRRLRDQSPGLAILVTTTTPTGSERVRAALGDQVAHCYLPYDLPPLVRVFLDRVAPAGAVFVETELWPNYLAACVRRGIPCVLANARLSQRSARGYRRLGTLSRGMFNQLAAVAAQTREDAARVIDLGTPADRVRVTGSVKFDLRLPASLWEQAQVLRRALGVDRDVWIAASTHEGEDDAVLGAFAELRHHRPEALLMLVPRHPERFARVAALARRRGWETALRTGDPATWPQAAVFIGDTMGELPLFYAAADVAFVGGSLVPVGGHNLLEPAALGLPVVMGPHLFNFAEISRLMVERGAAVVVHDGNALARVVGRWLEDANLRHQTGERGRRVVEENRGALQRLVRLVRETVPAVAGPDE